MAARRYKTQSEAAGAARSEEAEASAREMLKQPAIEMLPLSALQPWTRNARTHSKKQIRQIADSIERFGFTNPVLIDEDEHDPRRPRPGRGRASFSACRRSPACASRR